MTFTGITIEDYIPVCSEIKDRLRQTRIVALKGDLGSGKTTFVRALLESLESKSVVSSPTFSLINEYESNQGIIYHMDMYRLKTEEEALEIGIPEYLDSGNICLIEWPELIIPLVRDKYFQVEFFPESETTRTIKITNHSQ